MKKNIKINLKDTNNDSFQLDSYVNVIVCFH